MELKDPEIISAEAKKAYQQGKYMKAAEEFDLAKNSYRVQNKPVLAAEMANNQSVALLQAGNAELSLKAVLGTEEVFNQAGEVVKEAMAIGNRAAALEALNQLDEAEASYQKSADILKSNGESDLHAHVIKSLSALQIRRGKQLEGLLNMQSGVAGIENPNLKQRILQKLLKLPFKFIGR